ncbi:MAG: HDIG domain-containing protein [Acidimicrobiia bacterium]|nr:HDIG domain-containing protein [Acidimicrobiia bacterium]
MPGSWAHLARRFFWTLRAGDLTATELAEVERLLTPRQFALFVEQGPADRRHGWDAGRTVAKETDDLEVIRAALLHDIGKRHARLGVIGRTVASVLARLRIPAPGRLGLYLGHAALGAEELAAAGSSALVVDFTHTHHGRKPAGIEQATWDLLVRADTEVIGPTAQAG